MVVYPLVHKVSERIKMEAVSGFIKKNISKIGHIYFMGKGLVNAQRNEGKGFMVELEKDLQMQ